MANEFDIPLGTPATGWTTYAVVFDSTWSGTESILGDFVWNGSAFVADSFANRNAGAVLLSEIGATGEFVGNAPSGLPISNYFYLAFRKLGSSYDSQNDTSLLLGAGSFTVYTPTTEHIVSLTFDPNTPFVGAAQTMSMNLGSGTIFQIVPTASAVLDNADWEFRIGTKKYGISCVFNVAASNMVISPTGTITINPTVAQTTVLPTDQPVYGELWRVGPADDNIDCFARVLITIIDVLV